MRQTATKDRLLATGLEVLHAKGFHATGVQDITDAAKVPKGSFYSHFDSKEQFGADVLGRYWETRASRATMILGDEGKSPLERLEAYFGAKTERTGPFDKGCMIGNFSAEMAPDSRLVRDRLTSVLAAWTALLAGCIREAQAARQVRQDLDPETIAAFLIDAFEGAVLRTKVDRSPAALQRFHAIAFNLILTQGA
jgi:TetR/AcrR family transcriptional repressor of nem operon